MKPKPPCETVFPWLAANLGKRCIAPLTGTDARALKATVQTIELYSVHQDTKVLEAFALLVGCMQSSTRELAYHAIAHVLDWGDRSRIWVECGLPEFSPRCCAFEPAGRRMEGTPA